ncbi:MAG: UDP-N-acetylmuramoyl-L-alanine--D-glutamate ligase [bacterium]
MRVTILGAARSGLAAARLLRSHKSHVFVSDIQKADAKKNEIAALQKIGVAFEFGEHSDRIYEADLFVISPGISSTCEAVIRAKKIGIPVWSELELGFRFCPGPMIAISGSNGKSTTTTLIGEMFRQAGKKHVVAGNIGYPLSQAVSEMDSDSTAIVEVSSFQLENIKKFKPTIAVLLNITPDHLDRYENFTEYANTKLRLFENQTQADFAIFNAEDKTTARAVTESKYPSRRLPFHTRTELEFGCFVKKWWLQARSKHATLEILPVAQLALRGDHNLSNALAAIATALLSGIEVRPIQKALQSFNGLEHRLEFVRELDNVQYYNDSKATNPESLRQGLNSFKNPLIVIAGGRAKGDDFGKIKDLVAKKVKKMILLGESAGKMEQAMQNGIHISQVGCLEEALYEAKAESEAGDVVLLCPGCSSFDMFENFEDRGRQFKELVLRL